MSKIYTAEGWINWEFLYSECRAFQMVVGARGVGKTYGLFRYLLTNRIKFIYLRRLKTQLDECSTRESNPFKKINTDTGSNIQPFRAHNTIRFMEAILDGEKEIPTGEAVALGVALSTFASVRGADFSDIDCIVFDEAIPMSNEKPIPDEFNAFLNFYETVNRNRELEGKAPVKCFLLGNANKLGNPYFVGWEFMGTAIHMISGNQMMWRSPDNSRIMVMLLHSPISEKKGRTALYQNTGDDFIKMALDNAFRTDETNTRSMNLKEYTHIVSVGEIGIYKHKTLHDYYVSKVTQKINFYAGYGIRLEMFRHNYALFRLLYFDGSMTFQNYGVQLLFRSYMNLETV